MNWFREAYAGSAESLVLPEFYLLKIERERVDAIPLTGRCGAVIEYMTQVSATAGAHDLDPAHAVAKIQFGLDLAFRSRLVKAGPAAAGIILGFGGE